MQSAIQDGDHVFVSAVSLVEIAYLEEKQRLPTGMFDKLLHFVQQAGSGLTIVAMDLATAEALRRIPAQAIPDMPDRMIAATAAQLNVPIVSADSKVRAGPIQAIW
jgi:PIN domain nuclease of toxin-antitoxin system